MGRRVLGFCFWFSFWFRFGFPSLLSSVLKKIIRCCNITQNPFPFIQKSLVLKKGGCKNVFPYNAKKKRQLSQARFNQHSKTELQTCAQRPPPALLFVVALTRVVRLTSITSCALPTLPVFAAALLLITPGWECSRGTRNTFA